MKKADAEKYRTLLAAKREAIVDKLTRREDLWIVQSNEQIETVQLAGQGSLRPEARNARRKL